MQQYSYALHQVSDIASMLEQVQWQVAAVPRISGMLVTLYAPPAQKELLRQVQVRLLEAFPKAVLTGAVTRKQIMNSRLMEQAVVVTVTLFTRSEVELYAYALPEVSLQEAGEELLTLIRGASDVRAIQLFAAGKDLYLQPFLHELGKCVPEIRVFGGITDNGSLQGKGRLLAGKDVLNAGIVAVVYRGEDLHVALDYSFGWRPLGQKMRVTAMRGPFTMLEINHHPAARVYRDYLGIEEGEEFQLDALTFPIFLERHGLTLARHPFYSRPDGSLHFGADIYTGEEVQLAYGDPQSILDRADELVVKVAGFRPQVLFGVSCVARSLLMREDTEKELALCTFAPLGGFYAFGEFMRHESEIMVANMTFVLVGMREGRPEQSVVTLPPRQSHYDKRTADMRHLVNFIQTTIAELEEAKNRYRELARTDLLTHLYNRGATDHLLKKMLHEAAAQGKPLAVIMLDIDNFKGINDSFGHDAGDRALQDVAQILRQQTRLGVDVPGRMGGDEFFVVLRNTGMARAREVAERMHAHIAALEALPSGEHITTSIGIALAEDGDNEGTLFKRADNALYEAKKIQGKNAIACAKSD
ncbi:MAG: GGDEF domain-containing protein [Selenomonadaceae bacterium]|nr:GGDEF domain-containing protein [Selenomonadaceae bacterium]